MNEEQFQLKCKTIASDLKAQYGDNLCEDHAFDTAEGWVMTDDEVVIYFHDKFFKPAGITLAVAESIWKYC